MTTHIFEAACTYACVTNISPWGDPVVWYAYDCHVRLDINDGGLSLRRLRLRLAVGCIKQKDIR